MRYTNVTLIVQCFILFTAEFVINLAEKNDTFEKYKKVLEENGAEFSVSIRISIYTFCISLCSIHCTGISFEIIWIS